MAELTKEHKSRAISYDFKKQCEKRKISQKEVYRETSLCIDTQNKLMEKKCADSDTIALLHHIMGFDAPADIDDYKFLGLVLTAKYNHITYKSIAAACGITYDNFKRWERRFYTANENKHIYEYKNNILQFIKDKRSVDKSFQYVSGLKKEDKDLLQEGDTIPAGLVDLNLYLNHKTKRELLQSVKLTKKNNEIIISKAFIDFFDNWFSIVSRQ